mgnify:CR=1 FL=1
MKIIKYISKSEQLLGLNNFILSAFNLAFLSYYMDKKINITREYILWPDGIFAKLFISASKIAGSDLINNLILPKNINQLIVVGNLNKFNKAFLKKKFKIKIKHITIPRISYKQLNKVFIKTRKNSLCLITLPTPKQEILANKIGKNNKFYKIICIGGGLDIASGKIKKCPIFISRIGLEFIWRLRSDTFRRLLRLLETFIKFIIYFSLGKFDLKIKKI